MGDRLEGIYTALVTPFRGEGVDWDSLAEHIERQIEAGIHGIVPCGTTGESATLTAEEHDAVVRFAVERAQGRVPVMAGTGSNSTAEAIARTQVAKSCGADSALVITPYYNKPNRPGLVEHYRRVAGVGLPVIAYSVPSRTGLAIDSVTYRELADIPGLVATKEASGDLDVVERALSETSLVVFSGEDALTFPLLALGAQGAVSVVSNLEPKACVEMYAAFQAGDWDRARVIHRSLLPLVRTLFVESNPVPVKAAMAQRGWIDDAVRLPLAPASDRTRELIVNTLQAYAAFERS